MNISKSSNRTIPKHITVQLENDKKIEQFISNHEETHIGESLELITKQPRSKQVRKEIIGESVCSTYYTTTEHWFDCEFNRIPLSQQQVQYVFDRMIKAKEQLITTYDNKMKQSLQQVSESNKTLKQLNHVKEKSFWWKAFHGCEVNQYDHAFQEKLDNIKLVNEYSRKATNAEIQLSTLLKAVHEWRSANENCPR